MGCLGTVLKAVGSTVASVFLALVKLGKKPKKVHSVGGDKETRDEISDSIRDAADSDDDPK